MISYDDHGDFAECNPRNKKALPMRIQWDWMALDNQIGDAAGISKHECEQKSVTGSNKHLTRISQKSECESIVGDQTSEIHKNAWLYLPMHLLNVAGQIASTAATDVWPAQLSHQRWGLGAEEASWSARWSSSKPWSRWEPTSWPLRVVTVDGFQLDGSSSGSATCQWYHCTMVSSHGLLDGLAIASAGCQIQPTLPWVSQRCWTIFCFFLGGVQGFDP